MGYRLEVKVFILFILVAVLIVIVAIVIFLCSIGHFLFFVRSQLIILIHFVREYQNQNTERMLNGGMNVSECECE